MTIPIAIYMGLHMRFIRPGKIGEASIIGFILLLRHYTMDAMFAARSAVGRDFYTNSGNTYLCNDSLWLHCGNFAGVVLTCTA